MGFGASAHSGLAETAGIANFERRFAYSIGTLPFLENQISCGSIFFKLSASDDTRCRHDPAGPAACTITLLCNNSKKPEPRNAFTTGMSQATALRCHRSRPIRRRPPPTPEDVRNTPALPSAPRKTPANEMSTGGALFTRQNRIDENCREAKLFSA